MSSMAYQWLLINYLYIFTFIQNTYKKIFVFHKSIEISQEERNFKLKGDLRLLYKYVYKYVRL